MTVINGVSEFGSSLAYEQKSVASTKRRPPEKSVEMQLSELCYCDTP